MIKSIVLSSSSSITINKFLKSQIFNFVENGWDVHIFTGDYELDSDISSLASSVNIFRFNRFISPLSDAITLMRVTLELRRINPNVVLASTPKASLITILGAAFLRIKFRVYQIRGARWETLNGIKKILVYSSDLITIKLSKECIAVSKSLSELYQSNGKLQSKILVLGNGGSKGVDNKVFYPRIERNRFSYKIGYCGRAHLDKGILDVLYIFSNLAKDFSGIKLELLLLQDNQRIDDKLLEIDLDIRQRISVFENQTPNDVAKKISDWDFMLFLSKREGLPNSVLEASSCGTPVIGWEVTGVKDAICVGENGITFQLGDIIGVQEYIYNFYQEPFNPEARIKSVEFIQKRFSKTYVDSLMFNYIERLISA